jgi:hypothetical protein
MTWPCLLCWSLGVALAMAWTAFVFRLFWAPTRCEVCGRLTWTDQCKFCRGVHRHLETNGLMSLLMQSRSTSRVIPRRLTMDDQLAEPMDDQLADLMRQALAQHDALKAKPGGGGMAPGVLGGLLQQIFGQLLTQLLPQLLSSIGPMLTQMLQQLITGWLGKLPKPTGPTGGGGGGTIKSV